MHFALLNAEELGVTQANVEEMKTSPDQDVKRLLGVDGAFGEGVGLGNDWACSAIKAVGNYGEIFERNIGAELAAEDRARPERTVEQGRHPVRPAGPLSGDRTTARRRGSDVAPRLALRLGGAMVDGGRRRRHDARRRAERRAGFAAANDPQIRGDRLPGRSSRSHDRLRRLARQQHLDNLRRANIASGFGFLWHRAGFDISQTLIPYTPDSTYGRAFLVGLLNTLLVAVIGIVLATILGFLLGIARLSQNWLVAQLATVYVETIRNIPVLLQLLFWYKAVLSVLPGPRQGYALPLGANLSNRGLILPGSNCRPGILGDRVSR